MTNSASPVTSAAVSSTSHYFRSVHEWPVVTKSESPNIKALNSTDCEAQSHQYPECTMLCTWNTLGREAEKVKKGYKNGSYSKWNGIVLEW